ncbi:MAG: ATP-grasp domain-containing protein, partial [Francisellaceae bacterium]
RFCIWIYKIYYEARGTQGNNASLDISAGLTDQILDGSTHLGNVYPSQFSDCLETQELCQKMTEILRQEGVRGMVGVDLLIRRIDGKIIPYVLEVNARQTGAIYAGFLAYELRGQLKPWIGHNNITVPAGTDLYMYQAYLESKNVAYHHGDREGIMIICNGNIENNKMMILILAESRERTWELLKIAQGMKR